VIHDWLAVHCEYDYANLQTKTVPDDSYNLYGALVKKIAVCEGYARAYQYILREKLGIGCYYMSSESMNHAWNAVLIGGKYYHVDVTWDDPVNDRIGRVKHTYFLLSNSGICSAGSGNHDAGDQNISAEDTSYESANWSSIDSSFVYLNGKWYAADNTQKKLVSTTNLINGALSVSGFGLGTWKAGKNSGYSVGFSYLQKYHNMLILNGPKAIYVADSDMSELTLLYTPPVEELPDDTDSVVYNIYGFKMDGDTLCYSILSDPNADNHTYTASYPGLQELSGDVTIAGTYRYNQKLTAVASFSESVSGTVSYQWYRDGVKISNAVNQTYVLTSGDIGKVLRVVVTVDGYSGELSAETGSVQKALLTAPEETIQVEGKRGNKLSTVTLKTGYAWAVPDTVMASCGTQTYAMTYCTNSTLYETVTGLSATVIVSCETHELDEGSVTTEATAESTGIRTYHCKYCDYTEEEIIPKLQENDSSQGEGGNGDGNENGGNENQSGDNGSQSGDSGSQSGEGGSQSGEGGSQSGEGGIGDNGSQSGDSGSQTGDNGSQSGDNGSQSGESGSQTGASGNEDNGSKVEEGESQSGDNGSQSRQTTAKLRKGMTFTDTASGNKYKIIKVSGSALEVSFVGSTAKNKKSITIPATVKYAGKKLTVTQVAKNALKNNRSVTKVTVGKNVTSIGSSAFYGCKKLSFITLKGTKLRSFGKNCIKNISKKAVIKCPKSSKKLYRSKLTAKTGFIGSMKVK
ncbi:MAG: leucine-rich repeat protein, partial [Lachnospiraceae bacterium]|nr:leucine-rich repeat protein [Lachnospiraceae bacterium]